MNAIDEINKKINFFNDKIDTIVSIPDSKSVSNEDIHKMNVTMAEIANTMNKLGKGHIIPAESKSFIKTFVNANFDIAKLPKHYQTEFNRTYSEMSNAIKTKPTLKNSDAGTYCTIYEILSGEKIKRLVKRIRESKVGGKLNKSLENFDIDSIESFFHEAMIYANDPENECSREWGMFANLSTGLATATSTISNLSASINMITTVILILVFVIMIAVIALVVIYRQYSLDINRLLIELSESTIDNNYKLSSEYSGFRTTKADLSIKAIENLSSSISAPTRTLLIKPSELSFKIVNGLADKQYNNIDKMLKAGEKSSEALPAVIAGATTAITSFLAAHGLGIVIAASIIVVVPIIFWCIKSCIYYVMRTSIKFDEFIKDENQMLENDIYELEKRINNPATPEEERKRLIKSKEGTIKWLKTLTSMNERYQSIFNAASSDTVAELKEDAKIDFEEITTKIEEQEAAKVQNNEPIIEETPVNTGSNAIIF